MKSFLLYGIVAFFFSMGTASAGTLNFTVNGDMNPFLAGMPNGSTGLSDSAPAQSPLEVTGFALDAGDVLSFSVTGSVSHIGGTPSLPPDGGGLFSTQSGGANGIAGVISTPVDSLLGVFLTDDQPDLTAAPTRLDFSTAASRDFTSLAPELKQVFFIGDGLSFTSVMQEFVVPTGATRLFLGPHDGFGWFNNTGSFSVDVTGKLAAAVIPLPAAGWLFLSGLVGLGAIARQRRNAA